MSEDVARDILLSDPLSEITRRELKCLLAASVVGIAIAKADFVPSRITALGIEFTQTNQQSLMFVIGSISLYFLLAFIFYAFPDLLIWLRRFNRAQAKSVRKKLDLERDVEKIIKTTDSKELENIIKELEQTQKLIKKTIKATFTVALQRYLWKPSVILRVVFDFILPSCVGFYACWVLFFWSAPAPK